MSHKIYEGDEVLNELCTRPYYSNILAKVIFIAHSPHDLKWYPINANDCDCTFHAWITKNDRLENLCDYKKIIIPGDVYVVSVHNRYHSQLMMPRIAMVHFNVTKRQMIELWDIRQSNWYNNADELEYDENGNVIKNDTV